MCINNEEKVYGGKYGIITESNLQKLIDMGANRWQKAGRDRLYLSGAGAKIMGLEIERYNTGNISGAYLNDEKISNSAAKRIIGTYEDAYIDLTNGRLCVSDRAYYKDEFTEAMKQYITVA